MSLKEIEKERGGICWGGRELMLNLVLPHTTHSTLGAKMSSIKIADYVVNSECSNTSICLPCHFFGTVPHFNFGFHADAPVNPLHGSINTDYETTFYPTDANTKHSGINAVLQIASQSSSYNFMFKIRGLLLFIAKHHMHIHQILILSLVWRGNRSQGNWLTFIFLL
jgi:hypothetical protein